MMKVYMDATKGPFSYFFIYLTQECDRKFKCLSHLFDNIGRINVYIFEGHTYRKDIGYGNFDAIAFKNNNEQMIQFMPYQERSYNHIIYQPRLNNITHIGMPQTYLNDSHVRYELKNLNPNRAGGGADFAPTSEKCIFLNFLLR